MLLNFPSHGMPKSDCKISDFSLESNCFSTIFYLYISFSVAFQTAFAYIGVSCEISIANVFIPLTLMSDIKLQILVATFGLEGLGRIASGAGYPKVDGVEYLIGCQTGGSPIPSPFDIPEQIRRPDMKIHFYKGKGSPANRNRLFELATAPVVMIADDDLIYDASGITAVIKSFEQHPEIDFATFRFNYPNSPKDYPKCEFDYKRIPRGFWITNFEIALRKKVYSRIRYDERFGVNALFPAGEEDIYLLNILKSGANGLFLPITTGSHPNATTAGRLAVKAEFIESKGAVISLYHPHTYRLRILIQSIRYSRLHPEISASQFRRYAFEGIRKLRQSEKTDSRK